MTFNNHSNLVEHLYAQMRLPLPGEAAHAKVAPFKRPSAREILAEKKVVRQSAVLCLLYPKEDCSHFVLMMRPEYDGAHSGQIALPGGKHEPGETLAQTALRETHEEIGIEPSKVTVIGELTPVYVPPSNFLVTPYIGVLDSTPFFIPDDHEVDFLMEVSVADLLATSVIKEKEISVKIKSGESIRFVAPYFDLQEQTVWGATAAILSEFRHLLLAAEGS